MTAGGLRVDFLVSVWGDWHLDTLERAMLPTLLCEGNLPAALRSAEARVELLTCRRDVARIERLPRFRELASRVPCAVRVASEADEPEAREHITWWHAASLAARERGARVVVLHPDVVWADGAIPHMLEALARGRHAVLMPPNLRVVSETLLPALDARAALAGGLLPIPPAELVRLGVEHLHPLSALALDGAQHWLPALEHLWPVADEGFVVCQGARPVMAYDPAACVLTEKFFAGNLDGLEHVHAIRDSDDIFMLSLAPLAKSLGLAVFGHRSSPFELARWSANPYNENPVNRHLPLVAARLHHAPMTERLWRRAERSARATMTRALRWREVVKLFHVLRDQGCRRASQVLALAADALDLPRLLRGGGPSTLLVPSDAAFERLPKRELHELLAVGSEPRLAAFLCAHIVPGRHALDAGTTRLRTRAGRELALRGDGPSGPQLDASLAIVKTAVAGDHLIHVIDGALWDF